MTKEELYKKYSPVKREVIDYIFQCGYEAGLMANSPNKQQNINKEPKENKAEIKEVENIPETPKSITQRDLIKETVKKAYKERISQFEFEDERYNYKTLQSNVRDTLGMWYRREIYIPAYHKAQERIKLNTGKNCTHSFMYKDMSKAFSITTRTLEDRIHVYCTLHFEYLDNLFQIIYDEMVSE